MTDTATEIRRRLAVLAPSQLELRDDSALHVGHAGAQGGGGHYHLKIVSAAFEGRRRIERHRLVFEALGALMQRDIHALGIEALTPAETPATPAP